MFQFDSDPASWAALVHVAQLVKHLSGVQSVVGSNPTWGNSHFSFFHCLRCLSFFLSTSPMYNYFMNVQIQGHQKKRQVDDSRYTCNKLITCIIYLHYYNVGYYSLWPFHGCHDYDQLSYALNLMIANDVLVQSSAFLPNSLPHSHSFVVWYFLLMV